MSSLILIVEDEGDLVANLEYNLQKEGYRTRSARTAKEGLNGVAMEPVPDLVLLDLMLPDMPGTEVCRQIRQQDRTKQTPVIFLTAKGEEIDRIVGFEIGADDYLTKPFSVRELILRIRAVLRRSQSEEAAEGETLRFGELKIDKAAHRVWVGESEVGLTALEFRLLATFLARRGRVQTREKLLDDVWGIQADVTTRTVDTHVKRLRQKMGEMGVYIETIRGVGYRFCTTPEEVNV